MGDMVWDTADTMVDTDMVVTTWARGLLMPNLRPHLKPMLMLPLPTMVDTMAVDTVTELMALDTDMVDTVDTMAVDTDTVTDTDTTVKFLLNCKFLKPYFLSYN